MKTETTQEKIAWLKSYLKQKPWANWAKRQLVEYRNELKNKEKSDNENRNKI
jgi:hypothetical protein